MKRRLLCFALLLTAMGCAAGYQQSPASAPVSTIQGPVSVSYFYDNLSDDGQWFHDANYGWCWTPYDVGADWRPYSDGYWEYTDYGWSWVSNESFGWATYHYGRWFFDDSYGWAWVPGTEWAPAWVAWRSGDDWVGWAPLPPTARWDNSAGLEFADAGSIPSDQWCFVPREHLLDPRLNLQVYSVGRNVTLLQRSQDATRFEVRDGRPINVGIDVTIFERSLGHPVPRERVVDVSMPSRGGRGMGNGSIGYFRPTIRPASPDQAPAPNVQTRPTPMPDADLQRVRDQHQRKLDSDLAAEKSRLAQEQQDEMRKQPQGAAPDDIRQRQAAEQQALEAHAAKQRQVMEQRIQKQVVRPGKGNGRGQGNGNGKGKGNGKGNGNGNGNDQGNQ